MLLLDNNYKKDYIVIDLSTIGGNVIMQQITIRMTEEDLARIERIAKSAGLRKSDITRMAIRQSKRIKLTRR